MQLYEWHNGTRETEELALGAQWIFSDGIFLSLERSIEAYRYYTKKRDKYFTPKHFMLFESGGGEMFIINCDPASRDYLRIFKHNSGAADYKTVISVYDSFDSAIETTT